MDDHASASPVCRFCFELEGVDTTESASSTDSHRHVDRPLELVSPCSCTGTQQYVHRICLYRWQTAQLAGSISGRNPDPSKHLSCGVCATTFSGVSSPDIVEVAESNVGTRVVNCLGVGSLLVATRRASDRVLPEGNHMLLMLLNLKRAHWKHSVYFIYQYDVEDMATGTVRALNLTRLMDNTAEKPIPDEILFAREQYPWMRIMHFNGGPVHWGTVRTGLVILNTDIDSIPEPTHDSMDNDMIIIRQNDTSTIVISRFVKLAEYLDTYIRESYTEDQPLIVYSFSGYAQWNRLQLLGEFDKKSWGVVDSDESLRSADSVFCEPIDVARLWPSFHPRAVCSGGMPEGSVEPVSETSPDSAE